MRKIQIAVWLVTVAFATAAGTARAEDGHMGMDHGHMHAAMHGEAATGKGVGGAWAALQATRDAIAADVDAGKLGEIHAKTEGLVPQGQALLERSTDLAPDKRARVEGALKQLPGIADALHDAADAGKADEARRQLKRLDGLLELVRSQYPPAALTGAAPEAMMGHDMAMHGDHGSSMPGHTHATKPLAATDDAAKASITVKAGDFAFEPKTLEMRAGEPTRIELVNQGKVEHALVVAEPSGTGEWIHLHAQPGTTDAGTYEIDAPGSYKVLCTIPGHTEAGMAAQLLVKAH